MAALFVWLYWSTVRHLVGQWWNDPNFSHGFFVPLFSAFVIWQERDRLAKILPRPSWAGVVVLLTGLMMLIVGRLGAEIFLDRSSMLLVLAGVLILSVGWNLFRAVLFPWAFLLLMIPVPTIILNQLTFPLQLLASEVAAAILPVLGVPVLREGNVMNLPAMPLEVAVACSGIRSLMSLVTLAIIYGYLLEKRLWVRWLLALACDTHHRCRQRCPHRRHRIARPILGPRGGRGLFSCFLGMDHFRDLPANALRAACADSGCVSGEGRWRVRNSTLRFVVAALLIACAGAFLQSRARGEVFPPRPSLKEFPAHLDGWSGEDIAIDQETLDVLGHGDFLHRVYQTESQPANIDLFIAYFPSQRAGDTIHSPKNCLPGSGWSPIESRHITLSLPGHEPFPANRYVIAKGDSRQVVLYWYLGP